MSTFDSTKMPLSEIIKQIKEGKIQLPDFQRGWVWDDEHIRSLLISIAKSFPVGAVMLLESGGNVHFQERPIENIDLTPPLPQAEKLILDGQQRLTSLTQVLAIDAPVKTSTPKKKYIEKYYYINIQEALHGSLDDAFMDVENDKTLKENFGRDIKLDLSSPEKECQEFYFPCNQILNSDAWEESLQEFASEKFSEYMQFRKTVLNAFRNYQLPLIVLNKDTSKEAVCLIFEKVNTGGVHLSVFELVTAGFAAEGFNLRDDWYGDGSQGVEGRKQRIHAKPVLSSVEPTDFLQAITLLHTQEKRMADVAAGKTGKSVAAISAKRVAVLDLKLADYLRWADDVEEGFSLAAKFLIKECFFSVKDLPYRTQLAPLAAMLAKLKERWLEPRIFDKLSQWFWCGVLGELYGGAVETRIANDLDEVLAWIDSDDKLPRTVYEAAFQPNRLHTMRSRLSAAYKGLNVLVVRNGAQDFFWKDSIQSLDNNDINIDIHHIFPKAWCQGQDIKAGDYDSILNKTPISYKANRMIGSKAPSKYLQQIQTHEQVRLDDNGMDALLESHGIAPSMLRADDFNGFIAERQKTLLTLIEKAMGKSINQELSNIAPDDDNDDNLEA